MLITAIIAAFTNACEKKIKCSLTFSNGVFNTYDDTTGQRQCYLDYYGATPNAEAFPGVFKIKRHLTFTNKTDIGKQDAVIGVIRLTPEYFDKMTDISITERKITYSGMTFHFMEDVFPNVEEAQIKVS